MDKEQALKFASRLEKTLEEIRSQVIWSTDIAEIDLEQVNKGIEQIQEIRTFIEEN